MRWSRMALLVGVAIACATAEPARTEPAATIVYHNDRYGLTFSLPAPWQGYRVLTRQWESSRYDEKTDREKVVGRGPIIVLRDPRWRDGKPYQDIPILIFTRVQWNAGDQDGIYAGGVAYELAHSDRYIFAIHSRFDAADEVPGSVEAGRIVERNIAAHPHLPDRD